MRADASLCRLQTCLCILTQKQLEAQPRYVHTFWVHMHFGGKTLSLAMWPPVQLSVSIKESGTSEVFLDTRDLIINSVTDKQNGQDLPFKFSDEHKVRQSCNGETLGEGLDSFF